MLHNSICMKFRNSHNLSMVSESRRAVACILRVDEFAPGGYEGTGDEATKMPKLLKWKEYSCQNPSNCALYIRIHLKCVYAYKRI